MPKGTLNIIVFGIAVAALATLAALGVKVPPELQAALGLGVGWALKTPGELASK